MKALSDGIYGSRDKGVIHTFIDILKREWVQITLLTVLAISAPLFIRSPQLIVGSIVNFALFLSAKKFGFRKSLAVILLPSMVVYSVNILFGGATYLLLYFLPIIFVGNAIYVLLNRYLEWGVFNVIVASFCKGFVLLVFAYVFVKDVGLPVFFLNSMGVIQLFTGVIGGGVGYVFSRSRV